MKHLKVLLLGLIVFLFSRAEILAQAPTALAATNITTTSFSANWTSVSGSTNYLLDVSASPTFASFLLQNQGAFSTTYSVTVPSTGTYYYRVRAVSVTTGTSAYSNTISVLVQSPPAAPVATAATGVATTSFNANWNSASGATGYLLDVSTSSSFASYISGYNGFSLSALTKSITGLAEGTTYYYRVRAINSAGASSNSNTISATTTVTPPSVPTANAATAIMGTSFTANWSAASGAVSYLLDVSVVSNFSITLPGYTGLSVTGTSQNVTGLSAGATYYYRVRAVNAGGTSANSNTITVVTPLAIPNAPAAPSASSVTINSFTANWLSVAGATNYWIDVATDMSFVSLVVNNLSVSGTSQNVTGLSSGTVYYFRVRASNSSGTSPSSTATSVTTTIATPVATAATTITTTSFNANWNSIPGATSYLLDVSTSNTFASFISGYNGFSLTASIKNITSLLYGTTYYYRVRAIFPAGTSSNSNTITAVTTAAPPAAPTANAASNIADNSFTANWSVPFSGASSYLLDVSAVSNFSATLPGYTGLSVTGTSQDVTGLSTGVTYYYRVRAVNSSGVSPNSNTITVTALSLAPTLNTVTGITQTSFDISWSASNGATSYRLDVAKNISFSTLLSGYSNKTVNGTSANVTGLVEGTTYYCRVRAVNASGTSANSSSVSALTIVATPITMAATDLTGTSFTANWSYLEGATNYQLDVSTSSTFSTFISGYNAFTLTGISKTITGLTTGTTYYYRVRATNASGVSPNSNTILATPTTTTPAVPTATAATQILPTGFNANWNGVANATGYLIDVSLASNFSTFVTVYNNLAVLGLSAEEVTGLSPATTYYYRIRAVNAYGTSANSNVISVITAAAGPLALPATNVTATSFTANWNSVAGAVNYRLDVSTSSSFSSLLTNYSNLLVTVTNKIVTGLTPGTLYFYRVRASNVAANSNTISVTATSSTDQNYVLTKDFLNTSGTVQNLNYSYVDGLGRPIQSVAKQMSPLQNDIVQPIVYDAFGRESKKYLPYVYGNDGAYKPVTFDATGNYTGTAGNTYSNNASGKIAQDTRPFSETTFEPSPLSRPDKSYGPGAGWSVKPVQSQYLSNQHNTGASATQEKVIAWTINGSNMPIRGTVAAGYIVTGGYYSNGQISISVTIDEHGNVVREYTNKSGQVILKKVQAVAGSTNLNSTTDWALTYYIFDDLGNLRFVLPPEITAIIHQNDTNVPSTTDLTNWAFQYQYDARKRMTQKQVPGAGPVYMVYDNRDRLVMTQDANQRGSNKWLVTKYDMLNRPVVTATYTHGSSISQTDMSLLISSTNLFETYNAAPATHGYSNIVWPTSGYTVLTVTYYDNYKFVTDLSLGAAYAFATTDISGQQTANNALVLGQVTGSKVNILNSTNYLWNVNYYDDKYRTIQTIAQNTKAGTIRTTNVLDFPGRVLTTKRTYLVNGVTTNIKETFTYDNAGRLLTVKHSLNGAAEVMIAKNTYNELGQLVDKQLHSTDFTNFKQSADYRYNIRGWLTSMNNANLDVDANNDDTNDYFGMNLSYNTVDADLGNAALYNGNIAAMKWSNYSGTSTTKPKGYTYTYDAMNRITGSTFKEKTTSWATAANNGFAEMGYQYDLNGNLTRLQRNDKRSTGWMDNLYYNYGTGATRSNKLLRVEDTGDDYVGFIDGNATLASDFTTTNDDYRYDANGNLINDRNKGIGTSISDNTNVITYNFLNLPETITKGGNNVRYLYDANGTKLSQIVTTGTITKQTDYIGELVYENGYLQFVNHAEGRVMMSATKLLYTNNGESTTNITARLGAALAPVTQNGTEKYIRITSSATLGSGAFPIGGTYSVAAYERYRIRVKGYRSTNSGGPFIMIKANGNNVDWPGTRVPAGQASESWVEQIVTMPAGATTMQVGVVWNSTVANEIFFLNEFEITKLETTTPEYQYHLKDHLGNVRLTFTTKEETEASLATLEAANANAEKSKFVRYDNARIVNHYLFDKTNGSAPTTTAGAAQRLSGKTNEVYGLAKSLSVMPGDVINMEVYAKYIDSNTSNLTTALNTLVSQIAAGTAPGGTVIDGGTYGSSTTSFPFAGGLNGTTSSSGSGPKAYLNWLVFDRNYTLITAKSGYQRLTTAAKETGQDVAHERLSGTISVTEPGYVYIYLSNEEGASAYEVYFDEFKVDQVKSPVIQTDDYYPFGLTFNSYSRENSVSNQYLYNGKELQDELNLGLYDYIARQYDPVLGRFLSVDPLAGMMRRFSPYSYSFDNPIRFTDPDGMAPDDMIYLNEKGDEIHRVKNDQPDRTFVIKTTKTTSDIYTPQEIEAGKAGNSNPISKSEAKKTEAEISKGNVTGDHMNNVVEIENASTMKGMNNIVSQDNGRGGTSDANNREYGGEVSARGEITASEPGAVSNPKTENEASITNTTYGDDTRATFHSHPSGQIIEGPGSNTIGGSTTTYQFQQGPSSPDISNSGSQVNYVFGRRSGTVYIYNNTGVVATLPSKIFK